MAYNASKKIGNSYIAFESSGQISDYSLQVLADVASKSKNAKIIVTSLQRDAKGQMEAMYTNLVNTGPTAQYAIYGTNGDQVITAYVTAKAAGGNVSQIKAAMLAKINELGVDKVSNHAANPSELQVVDISKRRLANPVDFIAVARADSRISQALFENNVYHIEIPQINESTEPVIKGDSANKNISTLEDKPVKVVEWTNTGEYNGKIIDHLTDNVETFPAYGADSEDIITFEYNGVSNNKRLWQALDLPNKKLFGGNDGSYIANKDYPLGRGATIYIPISEISTSGDVKITNVSTTVTGNNTQTNKKSNNIIKEYNSNITVAKTNEARFYPKLLKYVSLDPGYTPAYKNRGITAKLIAPRLKVYIWSRALSLQGGQSGYIDVTPSVQQLSISSSMEGSEFTIKFSPLIGRLSVNSTSEIHSTQPVWEKSDEIMQDGGEIVALGNINRESTFKDPRVDSGEDISSEYIRNHQYYEKVLQQNDMVFVRFEQLNIDKDSEALAEDQVASSNWYDLIGLIDYAEVSSTAAMTDVAITAVGRDLTKALLEDNSYFNPYSVGHQGSLYGGDIGYNGRYLEGGFKDVAAITDRSIKQMMEFIFHRISSIGYVPDEVFDKFPNKTNISIQTKYPESESDKNTTEVKRARGIWQLVKFWIDDNIKDIRLVDDSVSNPQGSVWDLMKKAVQEPFLELFTETLGTHFYVIARKPPFEQSVLSKIVNEIGSSNSGTTGSENSGFEGGVSGVKASAYNKYLDCLDKKNVKVHAPRFSGSGFPSPSAEEQRRHALNQIGKIKVSSAEEKQYLEKFGAVIVDDKIVDCTEAMRDANNAKFPLIININEDDVYRDSFKQTQLAYSWYEVHDKGSFAGKDVSLGHIPAIYFDEYAQVFGNRKLEVTSNYSDFRFFETKDNPEKTNLYAEQTAQLLSFMVETNIHLPFTREGSFTVNGDRRIKKGNYIYYRPTREVFYVERVENNIMMGQNIDRTTTVTVSRGMVIDYIDGKEEVLSNKAGEEVTKLVSYFNIVDIPKLRDGIYNTVDGGAADDKFDHKADMAIDEDVMNFFLKKKQFKEYGV